jgi:SAM-dependent methyltransferase
MGAVEPTVIGDASLYLGDCIEVMRTLPANSIDAVVTDPPYGIRFMGKAWDGADIEERAKNRRDTDNHDPSAGPNGAHKSIAAEAGKYDLSPNAMQAFQLFSQEWAAEALRILKPGGHLLCFAAARSYHRMASGIEDAGFEVRDQCVSAGTSFFFKQWGEYVPAAWFDGPDSLGDDEECCFDPEKEPHAFIANDGRQWDTNGGRYMYPPLPLGHWCLMRRVGTKASGNLLDGKTWMQFTDEEKK